MVHNKGGVFDGKKRDKREKMPSSSWKANKNGREATVVGGIQIAVKGRKQSLTVRWGVGKRAKASQIGKNWNVTRISPRSKPRALRTHDREERR